MYKSTYSTAGECDDGGQTLKPNERSELHFAFKPLFIKSIGEFHTLGAGDAQQALGPVPAFAEGDAE